MVDAQFANDQYVDVEGRNREALAEANRRAALDAAAQPAKKSKAQEFSERALAIQEAAAVAEHQGRVILDELSQYSPKGVTISVEVKRLAPQQLLAGDLLPAGARKMVSHYVNLGTQATKGERARVGIEDITGQDVIDDVYDGDTMEAYKAYTGMIDAICIYCVIDPELHLYWNDAAKGDDPFGMVVSRLPFADREKIARWAMGQEEAAVASVAPFLQRPAQAVHPAPSVEGRHGEAERADQV